MKITKYIPRYVCLERKNTWPEDCKVFYKSSVESWITKDIFQDLGFKSFLCLEITLPKAGKQLWSIFPIVHTNHRQPDSVSSSAAQPQAISNHTNFTQWLTHDKMMYHQSFPPFFLMRYHISCWWYKIYIIPVQYVSICIYIMNVCMYACMHACMCVCMYVRTYVCMYACKYVCMYVCIYVYIMNVYIYMTYMTL